MTVPSGSLSVGSFVSPGGAPPCAPGAGGGWGGGVLGAAGPRFRRGARAFARKGGGVAGPADALLVVDPLAPHPLLRPPARVDLRPAVVAVADEERGSRH